MTRTFPGFNGLTSWTRLPHELIEAMPLVKTLGELKVILYILRHTWGFSKDKLTTYKRITLDELEHGRRRQDRSRIDSGTGLDRKTIIAGIASAVEHGFLEFKTDDHDRARIRKSYRLALAGDGDVSTPAVENAHVGRGMTPLRSEKETIDRNSGKTDAAGAAIDGSVLESTVLVEGQVLTATLPTNRMPPVMKTDGQAASHLSATTAYVRDVAQQTTDNRASCQFQKNEEVTLLKYEQAFGSKAIRDKADEFRTNGDRGRGLILHLLNYFKRYKPRTTSKPRQDEIITDLAQRARLATSAMNQVNDDKEYESVDPD